MSLCWTSFSVTSNAEHLVKGEELEKPPEPVAVADSTAPVVPGQPIFRGDAEAGTHSDDDDDYLPTTEKAWVFHLLMITASMYMAM